MLRLLALGLQSQSNNTSIKLFLLYFSSYHLSLCSSKSAGCFWGWMEGRFSSSCLPAHMPAGSQEGGSFLFLLPVRNCHWLTGRGLALFILLCLENTITHQIQNKRFHLTSAPPLVSETTTLCFSNENMYFSVIVASCASQ